MIKSEGHYKRQIMIQGLRSLIALIDENPATLTDQEIRNYVLDISVVHWNRGVTCSDVNHNGDFGKSCTNPTCFKYDPKVSG